jgi:hypothetical protein
LRGIKSTSLSENGIKFDVKPVSFLAKTFLLVNNTKKCLTYISKSHEDDVDFFHLENNRSQLSLFLLLGGRGCNQFEPLPK